MEIPHFNIAALLLDFWLQEISLFLFLVSALALGESGVM